MPPPEQWLIDTCATTAAPSSCEAQPPAIITDASEEMKARATERSRCFRKFNPTAAISSPRSLSSSARKSDADLGVPTKICRRRHGDEDMPTKTCRPRHGLRAFARPAISDGVSSPHVPMKLVSIPANPVPDDAVTGMIKTPDGVSLRFARFASRNPGLQQTLPDR